MRGPQRASYEGTVRPTLAPLDEGRFDHVRRVARGACDSRSMRLTNDTYSRAAAFLSDRNGVSKKLRAEVSALRSGIFR